MTNIGPVPVLNYEAGTILICNMRGQLRLARTPHLAHA